MPVKIQVVRTLTLRRGVYTLRYINIYTGKTLAGDFCRHWEEVKRCINILDKQYEGLM